MNIELQYVKMPPSESMSGYTTQRLNKLATKYEWVINAHVSFKFDKDSKGMNSICEMELSAPGPRIFASSREKNFEMAVKNTISDLEKQLKKRKAIFASHKN